MLKRPIPGGLLVAVEGIDGAGKTSVAALLAQWCGERGLACVISKEPTGLRYGQELRESAKAGRLTLERELELFALDRREHVERTIGPALRDDQVVILDRYFWSTAAYQGARGAEVRHCLELNEAFAPRPDLWLVLDLPVDTGLTRIRSRGDKPNEFESQVALRRSREIFQELAQSHPENARLVEAGAAARDCFRHCLGLFRQFAAAKIHRHGAQTHEGADFFLS